VTLSQARQGPRRLGEPITMTVTARHEHALDWRDGASATRRDLRHRSELRPRAEPTDRTRRGLRPRGRETHPGPRVTRLGLPPLRLRDRQDRDPGLALRYTPAGGGEPIAVETAPVKVEIVATVTNPRRSRPTSARGSGCPDLRAGSRSSPPSRRRGSRRSSDGRWWRKRRARPAAPEAIAPRPQRPATIAYLEALEALLRAGYLESGSSGVHVEIAENREAVPRRGPRSTRSTGRPGR